jgi:PEP-CTERM motif-containing protein
MTLRPLKALALTLLLLAAAPNADADTFKVTLDTSSLSGPQTLIFGLTDFDAAANTVSLSGFGLDGGSVVAGSEDCTFGGIFSGLGCSGDLSSGVLLEDLEPVVVFSQQFAPGLALSLTLTTTNNFVGPVPDQFAMFLCDSSGTCYSDDDSMAMLLLDMAGGSLTVSSFRPFGASAQNLDAPIVSAVPEPGTLLMLTSGFAAMFARRPGPFPLSSPNIHPRRPPSTAASRDRRAGRNAVGFLLRIAISL